MSEEREREKSMSKKAIDKLLPIERVVDKNKNGNERDREKREKKSIFFLFLLTVETKKKKEKKNYQFLPNLEHTCIMIGAI